MHSMTRVRTAHEAAMASSALAEREREVLLRAEREDGLFGEPEDFPVLLALADRELVHPVNLAVLDADRLYRLTAFGEQVVWQSRKQSARPR